MKQKSNKTTEKNRQNSLITQLSENKKTRQNFSVKLENKTKFDDTRI